jgi:hypothetical protein
MVIAFHANSVAIDDMDGFWLVGFADEKFDTRQYLMLQRSYEDDAQDVKLPGGPDLTNRRSSSGIIWRLARGMVAKRDAWCWQRLLW